MTRPLRSALVALALLLAGVGLALGAGTPAAAASGPAPTGPPAVADDPLLFQPVEVGPNTTRMLELGTVDAGGVGAGSVTVTTAMQAETGGTEAKLDRLALTERLAADADRERVLAAAIDRLEARTADLAERERAARERYRAGEIGPSGYLSTLGALNREARALESSVDSLEDLADGYPALQDRLAAITTDTVRYTGPVAEEAGAAVVGGDRTGEIFVAASGEGMALSTIRDGTYVREIMRTDARDDAVGGVDLDAAQSRIAELYPWAWAHKGDVSINTVGQDVFRFQLSHGHGVLNSLLDTSSGNVYREVQTKSLANLPAVAGPSTTVGNVTLAVSEPRAGGPVRVQVLNETGAPVPATVTANGTSVGTTGDGPVWLLAPTDPFTVTAETETGTLDLLVSPA
jgi:hypothetical protein